MKLTQTNFDKFLSNQDKFIDALNHRMTTIEVDVKWIKRAVYYMAGALSLAVGRVFIGI